MLLLVLEERVEDVAYAVRTLRLGTRV